jgi:hypothetical protein
MNAACLMNPNPTALHSSDRIDQRLREVEGEPVTYS